MADLDDFFAKKDKKKSKSKPKFTTTDELVKNLEDTSIREAQKPKRDPVPSVATTDNTGSVSNAETNEGGNSKEFQQTHSNDEEWKEFEVEERKDYSGLKIGRMVVGGDQNQLHQGDDSYDDDEVDSDGNTISDQRRGDPWKKVIPAEEVTQIPMEVEKRSVSTVYISPGMRHSQMMSVRSVRVRNRNAPDITNEDYFPTLGAARPEEQRKKKNEPAFEEVRHGSRVQRVQEQGPAPVAVGNRFQSLEEDDS